MDKTYDVAIIGGGPGGYVAAIQCAKLGLKVAVIEKYELGGVCLNWGCIPTKSLLKISEEYNFIKNKAHKVGIEAKDVKFDIAKAVAFSRDSVEKLVGGISFLMKKNKITVIKGEAKISSSKDLLVDNQKIKAQNIIIATGSRARELPGLKVDGKFIWDARSAMTPTKLPKSILIVGSGAIGMEFASFYNALGTKVTVIEIIDRILATEDEEIASLAKKSFESSGINIHTNSKIISTEKKKETIVANITNSEKKDSSIEVDHIIIAAGVVGNNENLGLESLKTIKVEKSWIMVNDNFETAEKNIFAIGDVIGSPCLAHKASHEGILVAKYIAATLKKDSKNNTIHKIKNIPSCIYSNPQIASIGITEQEAIKRGLSIKIGRSRAESNGKSIATGEMDSFVKVIFDKTNGELLGAHMIGHEVTEMIQGLVIAKELEATEEFLKSVIFPHPTISEMIYEAISDADGEAIHA